MSRKLSNGLRPLSSSSAKGRARGGRGVGVDTASSPPSPRPPEAPKEDVQQQSVVLDKWETRLDRREQRLDEREGRLNEREARLEQREMELSKDLREERKRPASRSLSHLGRRACRLKHAALLVRALRAYAQSPQWRSPPVLPSPHNASR